VRCWNRHSSSRNVCSCTCRSSLRLCRSCHAAICQASQADQLQLQAPDVFLHQTKDEYACYGRRIRPSGRETPYHQSRTGGATLDANLIEYSRCACTYVYLLGGARMYIMKAHNISRRKIAKGSKSTRIPGTQIIIIISKQKNLQVHQRSTHSLHDIPSPPSRTSNL